MKRQSRSALVAQKKAQPVVEADDLDLPDRILDEALQRETVLKDLRKMRMVEDRVIENSREESLSTTQLDAHDFALQHQKDSQTFYEAQRLITDNQNKLSKKLKATELGLSLGVIGAAEMQVHRLSAINNSLYQIEGRLIWMCENGGMSPDVMIDFYKTLVANAERAGKFITETGKSINWEGLKQEVAELEALKENYDSGAEKAAEVDGMILLRKLTEMQNKKTSEEKTSK